MLSEARPESASTLGSLAVGSAMAAVFFAGIAVQRKAALPSFRVRVGTAVAGALLLGAPWAELLWSRRGLEATDLVIALGLTPACIAIAASSLGGLTAGITGKLWPALASVAALLLILPEPSLRDPRSDLVLIFAPVLTGVGAAWFCSLGGGETTGYWRAAFALAGAGLGFGLTLAIQAVTSQAPASHLSLWAAAVDAPLLLLSVLALTGSGAMRWSAQFTIVPLIISIEGFWLARLGLNWRAGIGFVLLTVSSIALLLPPEEDEAPPRLTGGSNSVQPS